MGTSKKGEIKEPDKFFGLSVSDPNTPSKLIKLVVGLWLSCLVLVKLFINESAEEGQFGDLFGSVNALFSGLAFAGIIMTILLQREELKAQREELRLNTEALNDQKEELKGQREEFEKQNKNLIKQNFENSFFNSLNAKDTLVSMLNERQERFFERKYKELDDAYKVQNHFPAINKIRSFFYDNEWVIGQYFRNIIIILKMIDKSALRDDSKRFYINILQARMSNDELRVFLYNVISELNGDASDSPGTITYNERIEIQQLIKNYTFFEVLQAREAVGLIDPIADWELLRKLVYEPLP